MLCFGLLDVGTLLGEVFGFLTSQFFGEVFKGFFLFLSFLHFGCLSHIYIMSIFCDSKIPTFFVLRPPHSLFRYNILPFLISLRFSPNRSFFVCILFPFFLMYEYFEVGQHCLSVSFLFTCLGALLGSGGGCPKVGSFAPEGGALGFVQWCL